MIPIIAGSTSQTITLFLPDNTSTTGAGKTGLIASGLTAYYSKGISGVATAISLSDISLATGYTSGGLEEIEATNMPGLYRLDLPNAMVDTEGFVTLMVKGAAIATTTVRFDCRKTVPTNFAALSITAGGIAKADLDTIKTQTVATTGAGTITVPAAATLASTTNILSATVDTGVSVQKALEMLVAFVNGSVTVVSGAGISTYTYLKRGPGATSFTSACSETNGTRATEGALS